MHVIFIAGIKTTAVCCCFWEVLLHAGLRTLAECQERAWSQIAISLTRCLSSFGGIWCITLPKKHINFVRVFILDSWLES